MRRFDLRRLGSSTIHARLSAALLAGTIIAGFTGSISAQTLSMADPRPNPTVFDSAVHDQPAAEVQPASETPDPALQMPEHLRKRIVDYTGREAPGTVIVDTPNTHLYYVLPSGKAVRYGIGVGRAGFTWAGTQTVARKSEWPDWYPPSEMIARQPYLPRFVAGGPTNPLGARAMYLGNTEYRIHGTNQPETIGHNVSSGCIRMTNDDVIDLYSRVNIGAKVVVLPMTAKVQMPSQARVAVSAPKPATGESRGTITVVPAGSAAQTYATPSQSNVGVTQVSVSMPRVQAHGLY